MCGRLFRNILFMVKDSKFQLSTYSEGEIFSSDFIESGHAKMVRRTKKGSLVHFLWRFVTI